MCRLFPRLFLLLILALVLTSPPCPAGTGTVSNGVINLTVRIQDTVPYEAGDMDSVKQDLTDASLFLFKATRSQNRFGKIIIVVPAAWTQVEGALPVGDITDNDYDLLIPSFKAGYAHVNGLGVGGQCMTIGMPNFRDSSTVDRTVVHEFGHYGYDLYDEYMRSHAWLENGKWEWYKYFFDDGRWIKCTEKVIWKVKPTIAKWKESYSYEPGTPSANGSTASIMWFQHKPGITDFCQQSDHNSLVNSDQQLKRGTSCWEHMVKQQKFSLKLPGDPSLSPIAYEKPTFEIRQAAARRKAAFYLLGDTDQAGYSYPQPACIAVTLFNDDTPVAGARVVATITGPDGTVTELPLTDTGTRGDCFAADGSYEGDFVDYSGNGTYTYTVRADNPGHDAILGVGFPEPGANGSESETQVITGDFQADMAGTPFTVTGVVQKDLIPPGQIDNFDGTILPDGSVTFVWMATGNNMYDGKAQAYDLRYSSAPIRDEQDLDKATLLTGLPAPRACGEMENWTSSPFPAGAWYFALRAVDDQGRFSEPTWLALEVSAAGDTSTVAGMGAASSYNGSGLCFIATATYGSPFSPAVRALRNFRDQYLLPNRPGRFLVKTYYTWSPPAARAIAASPLLRGLAYHQMTPLVLLVAFPWTGVVALAGGILAALIAAGRRRPRQVDA